MAKLLANSQVGEVFLNDILNVYTAAGINLDNGSEKNSIVGNTLFGNANYNINTVSANGVIIGNSTYGLAVQNNGTNNIVDLNRN